MRMKTVERLIRRTVMVLALTVALLTAGVSPAMAFDKTDVEKIKASKSCEGCNLRHANLSGKNLSGANLSRADLSGANLKNVNLSNADLSGARFTDAVLSGADLTGANLTGANLAGAYMTKTDFSEAKWVNGKMCQPKSIGKCIQ